MQKVKDNIKLFLGANCLMICLLVCLNVSAQQNAGVRLPNQKFTVENGILKEIKPAQIIDSLLSELATDSLTVEGELGDSLKVDLQLGLADSLRTDLMVGLTDSLPKELSEEQIVADSILNAQLAQADSLGLELSKRDLKRLERRAEVEAGLRYSEFFRDSIPISRMCLYSMGVPGFGQLYNEQYWKIPIAYATLGASITGAVIQQKHYKTYKTQYDALMLQNADRDELDPVQTEMIKYNTYRQLMFAAVAASYIYFICDGAVNYPGSTTRVKKATTLSTILPGAGQFYNKSYWKVPIVIGGFASLAYVIDFNSRGYTRFKLAYELLTDGDDETVDEFGGKYSADFLSNYKKSYRRNRDLAILLTAGFYILNIIDAFVDAQFKEYDISDDLAMEVVPLVTNFYSAKSGSSNMFGMSLNIKF